MKYSTNTIIFHAVFLLFCSNPMKSYTNSGAKSILSLKNTQRADPSMLIWEKSCMFLTYIFQCDSCMIVQQREIAMSSPRVQQILSNCYLFYKLNVLQIHALNLAFYQYNLEWNFHSRKAAKERCVFSIKWIIYQNWLKCLSDIFLNRSTQSVDTTVYADTRSGEAKSLIILFKVEILSIRMNWSIRIKFWLIQQRRESMIKTIIHIQIHTMLHIT